MKFIGLGLLCLLCSLAWADEPSESVPELGESPEANENDFSQPWPIASFAVVDGHLVSAIGKANWFEANEACAQYGFTLAALPSQASANAMYNAIRKSGLQSQLTEPVWTSGTNMANNNVWSWFSTGDTLVHRNWANSQPASGSRCLAFNANNAYWTAELCNTKRHFVCQCT
ncbi:galactose-specific lectin nattectin-like [Drosophila innubila]|uniref:galactose-specific lectin nattectin-like n=1 Tax=Drosophila innubila TaxID=198719 RepID=UPI00148BBCCA|nr:galactose-specific lectin nattectin-like [Drosophila innubila]